MFFERLRKSKSKALKIRERTDVTKNRSKDGIQNTKKGEFSYKQLTLGDSFLEAATWRPYSCRPSTPALAWKAQPGEHEFGHK